VPSIQQRQAETRETRNTVDDGVWYSIDVHRMIALPRAIRDSVGPVVIVVHCNGGIVTEVFCRPCCR